MACPGSNATSRSTEPILMNLDFDTLPTPCYVVHAGLLEKNLKVLDEAQRRSGATIILALKGFAMFSLFPEIRRILKGTTASGLYEARLGFEEFGGEVHAYSPAFSREEMDELVKYADHISFNSFTQWETFRPVIEKAPRYISCGLRVNPRHSEVEVPLYDPCAPGSRLGILPEAFEGRDLSGLDGLHFHTMCEQNSDTLERTVQAFEKHFGRYIDGMQWVNFGGGHHITREDYDLDRLCEIVTRFRDKYGVQVYLEPGEAIALNTGFLVTSVLDIVENDGPCAILDTSATAHMPDILEMPYRPEIFGAGKRGDHPHCYRLGGQTCLAGDVIGEYAFPEPLRPGDRLVFLDMAHYTMVKNTTFNGIALPSIGIHRPETGRTEIIRRFDYEDYKSRLS